MGRMNFVIIKLYLSASVIKVWVSSLGNGFLYFLMNCKIFIDVSTLVTNVWNRFLTVGEIKFFFIYMLEWVVIYDPLDPPTEMKSITCCELRNYLQEKTLIILMFCIWFDDNMQFRFPLIGKENSFWYNWILHTLFCKYIL